MECRPAASNHGSGEGRAPFALGSEHSWDMDAPLWIATSYGVLEADPMNSCLTVMDVLSLEVFRARPALVGSCPSRGGWKIFRSF